MHTSTNESGYISPLPNIKRSNPFESPAEAILVSPLIEGTRTFHFRNKQKTLGQTPNKTNVIELDKNQIGSAHLITNPLGTELYITDETRWKEEDQSNTLNQNAKLFTMLTNLRNRSDTEYNFKMKGTFSPRHLFAARIKIKECIDQLKVCINLAPNKEQFLETINQRIQEKKFYNPFGLKRVYEQGNFDLAIANDCTIVYESLKLQDIFNPAFDKSRGMQHSFFSPPPKTSSMTSSTDKSTIKASASATKSANLMIPYSVLKAKRKNEAEEKSEKRAKLGSVDNSPFTSPGIEAGSRDLA